MKNKPKCKTQVQLDIIIRKAKGRHAVERMISQSGTYKHYALDNGTVLTINKFTGNVYKSKAKKVRVVPFDPNLPTLEDDSK